MTPKEEADKMKKIPTLHQQKRKDYVQAQQLKQKRKNKCTYRSQNKNYRISRTRNTVSLAKSFIASAMLVKNQINQQH